MTGVRQHPPQQATTQAFAQEAAQETRQEFEQRIHDARLGYWLAASICVVVLVTVVVVSVLPGVTTARLVAPLTPPRARQASVPPAGVTGAQLGGSLDAFTAAFGPAFISGSHTAIWNTYLNDHDLQVFAEAWHADGAATTEAAAVWRITLTYIVTLPPTLDQNIAICQQFFPSDAVPLADDPFFQPVEHLYQSQQLSASLPANAFRTSSGAAVLPGLFIVTYTTSTCVIAAGVK